MSTQHVLYVIAEGKSVNEPKDLVVELNSGDLYICNGEVHRVSSSLSSYDSSSTIHRSEIKEHSLYMSRNINATIPTNCGELHCISRGCKSDEIFVGGWGVFKLNLTSNGVTKLSESKRSPMLFCDPITENVYFVNENGGDKNVVKFNISNGKKENFNSKEEIGWKMPYGLAMDSLGNLYISDMIKNQVFKCSHFTKEETVYAGSGKQDYGVGDLKEEIGDGGLATDAQLRRPAGIVIDPITDDLYIADFCNFRIRKVSSTTGIISTFSGSIAGKSENGVIASKTLYKSPRNVDIDLNNVVYVADRGNNRVCKLVPIHNQRLKKYERDLMNHVNITCCLYVIQVIAPSFFSFLTNEQLISSLDANQVEIVQHLVDYLIYNIDDHYWYLNYCNLDILLIIGMIKDPQIRTLKNRMIRKFMNEFSADNYVPILEKTIKFKEAFPTSDFIDRLLNYVFERIAEILKTTQGLNYYPITQRYVLDTAQKLTTLCLGKPIIELESSTIETFPKFELLFNEKTTSDIIIKIGSMELYCHRTILSSYSSYFESLFNVGHLFQDLKNNIYEIETECFNDNLHEMIIKYCYGMFDLNSVTSDLILPLLQCSSFYNVTQLFNYCVENFEITNENIESLQSQLESFNNQRIDKRFQQFHSTNNNNNN